MPLALLLQHTFGTWRRDVARLNDWNQLVDLEDTLLRRARGVFLTRWFGPGLPVFAGSLRINVVNIDQLRARYNKLQAESQRQNSDLNLTEPIAGIAGTMVGAMLSPTSSMVLMATIAQEMPNWVTTLAAVLNWLTFGSLSVLVFAAGVPLAGAATPFAAVAKRDTLAVLHRSLGGLARLFSAARRFLEQLLGPRDEVKNPLLRQILGVMDHAAELLPFLFGFAAIILVWVGPRLSPLAKQLDALIPLAKSVFGLVSVILADFFERLQSLYTGDESPWAVLQRIIGAFGGLFKFFADQFRKVAGVAAPAFELVPVNPKQPAGKKESRAMHEIVRLLAGAFDKVMPFVKQLTTESWLVRLIKEIGYRFGKIADVLKGVKTPPPGPKEPPGWAERQITPLIPEPPTSLKFPKTPVIPDLVTAAEIFNREEGYAMFRRTQPDVDAWMRRDVPKVGYMFVHLPEDEAELRKLRSAPTDIFAPERAALLKGESPEDVLKQAQEKETELRTMLFTVIDKLLPAAVADAVPMLQGRLWELDAALYGDKAQFPVRDVPGGDRLSVRAGKLRVHAPGMKHSMVKRWSEDLRTALKGQIYRTEFSRATAAPAAP